MSEANQQTPVQDQNTAIPWYKSQIVRRLSVCIVSIILSKTGLSGTFADAQVAMIVDDVLEAIGVASAGWAIHARVTKPTPPIVATQTKADLVNTLDPLAKTPPPVKPPDITA